MYKGFEASLFTLEVTKWTIEMWNNSIYVKLLLFENLVLNRLLLSTHFRPDTE